jgi:hypothetical protein
MISSLNIFNNKIQLIYDFENYQISMYREYIEDFLSISTDELKKERIYNMSTACFINNNLNEDFNRIYDDYQNNITERINYAIDKKLKELIFIESHGKTFFNLNDKIEELKTFELLK